MGARDYGSDAYWIDRYEKRGDEWRIIERV